MNTDIKNTKYSIDYELINTSLNNLEILRESLTQVNINKIINFSKNLENYYKILYRS